MIIPPAPTRLLSIVVPIVWMGTASSDPLPTADPDSPGISYEVPSDGFVSLALYDSGNTLVRTLSHAEQTDAGDHRVIWDGTTDLGLPAVPGDYHAKGIFFKQPPTLDYVMKVGKSGSPPYRHPTGDWGANLSHPTSLASNSRSILMGWGAVEDSVTTGVQLTDADGKIERRFFTFYPWDARSAAAMDEEHLYLGIYNITGDGTEGKRTEIAVYDLENPRGRILTRLPVEPTPTVSGRWQNRLFSAVDGMVVHGNLLYASISHENALFVIDAATGDIRRRTEIPDVRGLAISAGRLLAVSGRRVLELSPDGDVLRTVIDQGLLEAPHAITSDETGLIYVGDSGAHYGRDPERRAGTRQVHVFSPEGDLVRKLGKEGGAPYEGGFDPAGFGVITAMTIGPRGKLWVMDIATGFHRTSRWSTDGRLEEQWFSRKIQHEADIINPAHPDTLISARDAFDDSPPGLYAYEIDLEKKTWQPAWHFPLTRERIYGPAEGVFASHHHGGNPLGDADPRLKWPIFNYGKPSFVTKDGRDYLFSGDGNGEGSIHLYGAGHAPKPAALVSFHRVERKDGLYQASYDSGPNNWLTWADHDGDGKMSAEEIIFTENPGELERFKRVLDARMTEDLALHLILLPIRESTEPLAYAVLRPNLILPNGAPLYDWKDLKFPTPLLMPDLRGGDGTGITGFGFRTPLVTEDGLYSIVDPYPAEPERLPGLDGDGWWASRNWRKRLVRWDEQTGKPLWAVGRRAPGVARAGQMHNPVWLSGVADDAAFLADALGVVWVWDTRGLYLGRLYNAMPDQPQDADTLYIELMGTEIHKHPESGKLYSIANDFGASIHEIILPERHPVDAGTVTLTPEQSRRATPWDPEGQDPGAKPEFTAYRTSADIEIDGEFDDREQWARHGSGDSSRSRPSMLVLMDGERLADVRVMYDQENLYLGYRISAPNGALNVGSELPYAPFVSGAYVDFHVAPDWSRPQRGEVMDGDVRVILAKIGSDRSKGTLFQQGFWQSLQDGERPWEITSPAASVHFDHISEVPGLRFAYRVDESESKGAGRTAYGVEVAVPLKSLGLEEPAGRSIGFNVSIGVADATGTERSRAHHWSGLTESRVVDRPGSARLLPHTWGTLHFSNE